MIDFHCHITTSGSRPPHPDGAYYRPLKPVVESGDWVNFVWMETIETVAESLRSTEMLQGYRQVLPIIYSEMARRLFVTNAERLILEMAKHGVRQAVAVAMDPFVPTKDVVSACIPTKDILIPFGSGDPWADDWREKLLENLSQPIAGFKFHFALQRLPLGCRRMYEMLDVITQKRPSLAVYLHTGDFPIYKPMDGDWAAELAGLLETYPRTTFVCGHCGWNRPSMALRAALRHKNLLLETSWQPPQVIRRLCKVLGPRRLLLGSDYPLSSMRRAIRNCRVALTPEEFALVGMTNAKLLIDKGRQET